MDARRNFEEYAKTLHVGDRLIIIKNVGGGRRSVVWGRLANIEGYEIALERLDGPATVNYDEIIRIVEGGEIDIITKLEAILNGETSELGRLWHRSAWINPAYASDIEDRIMVVLMMNRDRGLAGNLVTAQVNEAMPPEIQFTEAIVVLALDKMSRQGLVENIKGGWRLL